MIGVPTNWETCESLETTSCNGEDAFQRYLKCFVDIWRQCESQEDCENSGSCTDREWTTIVRSAEHPIDVQFGACFASGEKALADLRDPHCLISADRPGIGCRERLVESPEGCHAASAENWRTWLTPATSEAECRNKNDGRYGCQLPGPEKSLNWLDDEECSCDGGINDYAWSWSDGVWSNGVSRTLEWREVQPIQKYQWTPVLSFELLQTWLEKNEDQRFSFTIKSEVICENGYVSTPLNTLVCDCTNDEAADDSQCYSESSDQVQQFVGLVGACSNEISFVKGPSSRVSFALDSISSGCTLVNLSIVSKAWFVVPPPRPSISFEFEEKPQRGIVLNQKLATVGVLRGDGSVLSFVDLENVRSFSVCLLVSENETDISKYPVPDFGYSKETRGTIFPLGISNLNETLLFGSQFWCGSIVIKDFPSLKGNDVRLYPISRAENYEKEEEEYTSQQTRALMYTLGVCYCICFVLLMFFFITFIKHPNKAQMLGILSFLLIVLCVFRAIFMFAYPNGTFDGNELAEFVVFEIPTFLLFSVVITSIFFWRKLSRRNKFFEDDSNKLRGVIFFGLIFVWSLWVIVTIVYAEVILEEDGESPCPGRVAPSYDEQKEDTRTLTIVYQSLIITVTVILGLIFCYYSHGLIKISKTVNRSKQFVMVIGGVIILSFLIRSILFIIILAVEFVSSIYMFITLMITEVFLLFFLQLQFNSSNLRFLLTGSLSVAIQTTSGSRQSAAATIDN